MPEKISLDWSEKDVIEDVSFPRDTLNRAKYAEFLTRFSWGKVTTQLESLAMKSVIMYSTLIPNGVLVKPTF